MTFAPSKDSDQPGHLPSLITLCCPHEEALGHQLPRLIWVFTGRTDQYHFVGFIMRWLISSFSCSMGRLWSMVGKQTLRHLTLIHSQETNSAAPNSYPWTGNKLCGTWLLSMVGKQTVWHLPFVYMSCVNLTTCIRTVPKFGKIWGQI